MIDTLQYRLSRKIDLQDFMEKNFRCDMSMSEFARASGRSLSTFKRDFKKMSELSPERWLTDRRLRAAFDLLKRGYDLFKPREFVRHLRFRITAKVSFAADRRHP